MRDCMGGPLVEAPFLARVGTFHSQSVGMGRARCTRGGWVVAFTRSPTQANNNWETSGEAPRGNHRGNPWGDTCGNLWG